MSDPNGIIDIWAEIEAAVRQVGERPRDLDKYLVNGALLVTPRQFLDLKRWAEAVEDQDLQRGPSAPPQIPVIVVRSQPTDVGGGKMAFVGPDGMIYVFDKAALTPTWEHPPLRLLPDTRYPLL